MAPTLRSAERNSNACRAAPGSCRSSSVAAAASRLTSRPGAKVSSNNAAACSAAAPATTTPAVVAAHGPGGEGAVPPPDKITTQVLPPSHPDLWPEAARRLRARYHAAQRRGAANPIPGGLAQQVYTEDSLAVIAVPVEAIEHMPASGLHVKTLVLCARHDPRGDNSTADGHTCPKGNRCKFVHCLLPKRVLASLPRSVVHVNYAYRKVTECQYPRATDRVASQQPHQQLYPVHTPDGSTVADELPLERFLMTRALEPLLAAQAAGASGDANGDGCSGDGDAPASAPLAVLKHCAHYYFIRCCILGAECHYAHTIHIDRKASRNQRAPAPGERSRSPALAASRSSPSSSSLLQEEESGSGGPADHGAFCIAGVRGPLAPLRSGSPPATAVAPLAVEGGTPRFRHDPYGCSPGGIHFVRAHARAVDGPTGGKSSGALGGACVQRTARGRYRHDPYGSTPTGVVPVVTVSTLRIAARSAVSADAASSSDSDTGGATEGAARRPFATVSDDGLPSDVESQSVASHP